MNPKPVLEKLIVPSLENPVRLSDFVPERFTAISSRKGMKKAIKKGLVSVNGKPADTGHFLLGGETIALHQEVEQPTSFTLDLEVMYEDDHLAVVVKPAGILVSGNKARTIAHVLKQNLKASPLPDALPHPLAAHRLDFPTSGLLLIGKTRSTHQALNQLFEDKQIQKTYCAIAVGQLAKEGVIETPIADKPASTAFEVMACIPSLKFQHLSLVRLHPATGRRHQLRIHLASLGNPILGDKDYANHEAATFGKGLYLHAAALTFKHPVTQQSLHIAKTLPPKFHKLFPGFKP